VHAPLGGDALGRHALLEQRADRVVGQRSSAAFSAGSDASDNTASIAASRIAVWSASPMP
jgi:hypothetical protein